MAYVSYTAVTPSVGDNPKSNGWYEYDSVNALYFRTSDTTVQNGKTYYNRSNGYLVKLGSGGSAYTIPLKYIKADTYKCVWSVTDVDSYRDANGELHRDGVLDRRIMKVEFETPDLDDVDLQKLLSGIKGAYISAVAKSCNVTAYMPEEGAYKTDKCYLTSDVNIQIRYADNGKLRYDPIRFAFIGYGTSSAT